jgi:hypothetical protein
MYSHSLLLLDLTIKSMVRSEDTRMRAAAATRIDAGR